MMMMMMINNTPVIILCVYHSKAVSHVIVIWCRTIIYSEKHVLLMWSIAFYVAENFVHELKEMDFVTKLFQVICHVMCCVIVPLNVSDIFAIYLFQLQFAWTFWTFCGFY